MTVCIGLFVLSWAILDRYPTIAAVVVSVVALAIPRSPRSSRTRPARRIGGARNGPCLHTAGAGRPVRSGPVGSYNLVMADDASAQAREDQRATHEDRDRVVDVLRLAAGDGRLTLEELDERVGRP